MTPRVRSMFTAIVTAVLLAFWAPSWAISPEPGIQDMVDDLLAQHPGGEQTGWNEVSWQGGEVVLTLMSDDPSADPLAVNCAAGRFCAYDGSNYSGNRITFSTCTNYHSVAQLVRPVRSMYNARGSGTIRAYSGSTLLASATAGRGTNVSGTTSHISCS